MDFGGRVFLLGGLALHFCCFLWNDFGGCLESANIVVLRVVVLCFLCLHFGALSASRDLDWEGKGYF